ncbi:GIN domain-containing protein [Hymenobacter lapidiphilus]|uniref:DUF2807 domain-containing protein n=1 Tax=Hymenobacter lapidiphilus TaxID=2608003 RepID=A0A7Y7PLJ9_9BACT|nr:DUF2807 domain-containing protein [Hymenobacter lapidiphilus]NVO30033.1 DUF2807 domain-containing protein [Hymenobacter lapidiphilus]
MQGSAPGRVLRTATVLALATMLGSCQKDSEAGCFTSTGNIVTERRSLPPFQQLTTYDNITVILVQDTASFAEVRTGKNLQDDIRLEVANGMLTVRNSSRCNWVRRYNTPREVTLHLPRLTDLFLRGQADIRTEGPFRQDTIFPHLVGAGDLRLHLISRYVNMDQYELGNIYLTGSTDELHHTLGGSGSLYAQELGLRDAYLQTNSSSDGNARLRPSRLLVGTHAGTGTVFYAPPAPTTLTLAVTGRGQLRPE